MKTITLIRHAKSSWEHEVTDKDRPLKGRGITDAKLVSSYFKELNFNPEKVFSSPANRAFSTCRIFTEKLGISDNIIEKNDLLYDFDGFGVLNFIKSIDNNYKNVMLFGHNDAFNHLVNNLGSKTIDNFPTSGLAVISFDIDKWADIKKGKTIELITPRQLKS